jgi:peroxiredoxin Q/BCP
MSEEVPQAGSLAPDFTLKTQTGEEVTLSSFRNSKAVLLYFYPKADTPGCTTEACNFRDSYAAFQDMGVQILGVSPDTVRKQAKFADKYTLPFPLLADEDHAVAELYGVWKEKSFMGKRYMGVERSTFLIDKLGVIRKIYPKVSVTGHALETLDAIRAIVSE